MQMNLRLCKNKNKTYNNFFYTIEIEILENETITVNTDLCYSIFGLKITDSLKKTYNITYSSNISAIDIIENYILMFDDEKDCNRFIELLDSIQVMDTLNGV